MLGNFSEESQFILLKAREEMLDLNHPYVGTEHLVLSILKNEEDISLRLASYGLNYDNFKKEIIEIIGRGSKKSPFFLHTPLLKKVMENAMLDAKDNNNGEVMPIHLVSSLLEEGEGIAIRIFINMGINLDDMYDEFSSKLIKRSKKKKKKLLIEELGVNLVDKALRGELDPVVGRDKEMKRLIEILCRRGKNNPILIGDAGVGKTAIVEELASLISSHDVPLGLQNKRIISLDLANVVSGTKYRGEFEERMQKLIKEISLDGNIILFIDEIHTLVGAGGAEGAIDASNILKPALARGNIKCIGATTLSEYKRYIECDKALDRRFQKIMIEEPNEKDTFLILKRLKPIYEKFHHVNISFDILKNIVDLSNRYVFDRKNPDKSIDILDEVCSRVSIRESDVEKEYCLLKKKLLDVQKKKNTLIMDSDIKSAYRYLKEEANISSKINDLELSIHPLKKEISLEDVAYVVHEKCGVPIYEILKDDVLGFSKLESELKRNIVGQDKAICELVRSAKRNRFGYSNHKVESYLFVGPTGVGKTNLAKVYADVMMGKGNLIRFDMSEYSDAISVHKIIGAAPGYVGYQDQNTMLSKIKDKPASVLLLDEIDKAHDSVINLLYQMLDDGMIRDANNDIVYLNHNIIIMTSNLGFEDIKVGFMGDNCHVVDSLKQKFPVSLINRIHHVIAFDSLKEGDIHFIVRRKLNDLKLKYSGFRYCSSLVKEIILESEYQEYGARKIDKIIESKVENLIIDKLMNHEELSIEHLGEYQGTV